MRQVLCGLELASVVAASSVAPAVRGSAPDSRAPTGQPSPADYWRERYNDAPGPTSRAAVAVAAGHELAHLRRRRFAVGAAHDGEDLRARVLREGEGASLAEVAMALRCTPTFVRRTRLAAGRETERGKRVAAKLDASAMLAAGLSLRAVAIATGTPRSTLHDRRARPGANAP